MERFEKNLIVIIMAGGSGTRFWPLSTHALPKQFIRLFDDRSLLQKSYDRVAGIVPDERILVVTNRRFTPRVREQLPAIPDRNIIGEPERRDTAATVCLGSLIARRRFGNPVIIVVTADHVIEPHAQFQHTIMSAAQHARSSGALYTIGIRPTCAATGFGYLKLGEKINTDPDVEHFHVKAFTEKPDTEVAGHYLTSGQYVWNSGMFAWTAESIIAQLTQHLPDHVEHVSRAVETIDSDTWEHELQKRFSALKRTSIDYAVMEKARNIRCALGDFCWKDVGGWLALQDFLPHDDNGNCIKGRVHALDAHDNLVYCDQPHELLVLVGVSDIVVVRVGEKTLIAHKDRLEDVKRIVESMPDQNR